MIELDTLQGTDSYRVERTWVVDPEDVSVLDPTSTRALTLVTCYPFYFVGSAPQRFIVRAVLAGDKVASSPPPTHLVSLCGNRRFVAVFGFRMSRKCSTQTEMERCMSRSMSGVAMAAAVVCLTAVASLAQTTTTSSETKTFEVLAVTGNTLDVRLPEGTRETDGPR